MYNDTSYRVFQKGFRFADGHHKPLGGERFDEAILRFTNSKSHQT
jgi:hypothetical protein